MDKYRHRTNVFTSKIAHFYRLPLEEAGCQVSQVKLLLFLFSRPTHGTLVGKVGDTGWRRQRWQKTIHHSPNYFHPKRLKMFLKDCHIFQRETLFGINIAIIAMHLLLKLYVFIVQNDYP